MECRYYQNNAINSALYLLEAEGHENIVLSASVSWGKSLFLSEMAKQLTGKVLIVVNITKLIDQIARHLDEIGEDYSILKAGYEDQFDASKKIQLVMSQTFHARYETIDFGEVSWILQDECHREWMTERTMSILRKVKPQGRCGVSGTPYDESGYALIGVNEIIESISVSQLEDEGFTAPLKYFIPKWSEVIDYDNLRSSGSDFSGTAIDELINTDSYAKLVVESMNSMNAKDKKTLVFANSIEHADRLTEALNKDGYSAYSYHSESDKDAELMMQSFASGRPVDVGLIGVQPVIKCIVSVSKIAIGFDVPDVQLGVMCRPTKVLSLWRQQLGRVQRASSGKEYGEILDLCGGIGRHGFHDEPYSPPTRGDKKALLKEQERLAAPTIVTLVGEEPTEITREIIQSRVEELERKSKNIPAMDVKELIALYDTTTSIAMAIWVGYEMQRRKTGQCYTIDSVSWTAAPWLRAFEDDPDRARHFIKAAKTRIKNIVRDGKKMSAMHYFCGFLIEHENDDYRGR